MLVSVVCTDREQVNVKHAYTRLLSIACIQGYYCQRLTRSVLTFIMRI